MPSLTISTQASPYYSLTTTLEGTAYQFDFRWSQREAAYYLSIGLPNPAGDPTPLASFKIVSNWPLLRRFTDTRLPPGELIAMCARTGDTSPPKVADLGPGLRCELTYLTSDTLS